MTHLQEWLRENKLSIVAFARELGVSKDPIYLLATPDRPQWRRFHSVRFDILEAVAVRTGIEPGTLINDVVLNGEGE